jgi:hypothetical protein
MNHAGHFIQQCSCGAVIAQCRCLDKNKPVEVVQDGWDACKKKKGKQ